MSSGRVQIHLRLHPRCYSILESYRDETLSRSMQAAIDKLIIEFHRLHEQERRNGSGPKLGPKLDANT